MSTLNLSAGHSGLAQPGRKIKVLWLCSPLEPRYGVMNIVRGWASAFDFDRFDVTFAFCSPNPDELRSRLAPFPALRLESMPELLSLNRAYIPALRSLRRLMRREQFDVVHTIFVQSDILGSFAARSSGVPVVVSSVMGYLVVPLGGAHWKVPAYKAAYRLASRRIDRVMAITRTTGEQLVQDFGVRPERVQVVYSGVPQQQYPRPLRADDSMVIGSVGMLIPQKGVETFVRAIPLVLAQCPGARFLIAGDGPERAALESLAARLGVSGRLDFLGFREDVPALMATLDTFVFSAFPSYDGLPRVILEAMVQGTPVVAARTHPIEEIVVEGSTGWLYEPGDAEGMATALERVRTTPDTPRIVENALSQVRQISIERELEQIQGTYLELLGRQQSAAPVSGAPSRHSS
jgi:glycosyltransferase involved in cell wall biosynthesis